MLAHRCLWILAAVLLPALLSLPGVGGSGRADELKTLAGKNVSGALEKITDDEISLKTASGSVSTPLPQVLDLTLRPTRSTPAAEKHIEVQLNDESVLRCSKIVFGPKELDLELTSGARVKVPLTAFVSMLRDAQDPQIQKQWKKVAKAKVRNDRIFVLNMGDLNSIEGLLREIDAQGATIKFKREGATEVDIKLERLQGMSFVRTEAPTEPSLCKVIDVDGNSLVASKLAFTGTELTVRTAFGTKVALDPKWIARFDFNFGRLTYLSDLEAKIRNSPLLGGFNAVRKDVNLDGHTIMLLDKQYAKGLSLYAGVELEYNLEGKYKEFKALLGADARIAEEGQGKVTVSIYCDQEKRFSELVTTKAAKNIAINVKDVNQLRIVVSGTNFTHYSGHATLANAQVSQ